MKKFCIAGIMAIAALGVSGAPRGHTTAQDGQASWTSAEVLGMGGSTTPDTSGSYKAYLSNTSNWSSPYVWSWNDAEANCTASGIWPGDKMTYDSSNNLWSWTAPAGTEPGYIIFSDSGYSMTADLDFVNNAVYNCDGDIIGTLEIEEPEEPQQPEIPAEVTENFGTLYEWENVPRKGDDLSVVTVIQSPNTGYEYALSGCYTNGSYLMMYGREYEASLSFSLPYDCTQIDILTTSLCSENQLNYIDFYANGDLVQSEVLLNKRDAVFSISIPEEYQAAGTVYMFRNPKTGYNPQIQALTYHYASGVVEEPVDPTPDCTVRLMGIGGDWSYGIEPAYLENGCAIFVVENWTDDTEVKFRDGVEWYGIDGEVVNEEWFVPGMGNIILPAEANGNTVTLTFALDNHHFKVEWDETEEPVQPGESFMVYWDNSSTNWTIPYVFCWNETDFLMTWPGDAMTLIDGNVWGYEVPASATGLIFNDRNGNQSNDFDALANHVYNISGDQGIYGQEEQPLEVAFTSLVDNCDNWIFDNKYLGEGLGYVWVWKEYNGAGYINGSAYKDGANFESTSYAYVTLDLSNCSRATLTFDHAAKFQTTLRDLCGVVVKEHNSSNWTKLNVPTWPGSGSWTWVNSGEIDLSAYTGTVVDLGFVYGSDESGADTWEIKNFTVMADGAVSVYEEVVTPPTPIGQPLYIVGAGDGLAWDVVNPGVIYPYDGYYCVNITNLSAFKISTTYGDWYDFNNNARTCDEITAPGEYDLYYGDTDIRLPWTGDWTVVISENLSTIRVATDTPKPTTIDAYIRGNVNGWEYGDEWKFSTEDNVVYTYEIYDPEILEAMTEMRWKIADDSWNKINFEAYDPVVVNGYEQYLNYNVDDLDMRIDWDGIEMQPVRIIFTYNGKENSTIRIETINAIPEPVLEYNSTAETLTHADFEEAGRTAMLVEGDINVYVYGNEVTIYNWLGYEGYDLKLTLNLEEESVTELKSLCNGVVLSTYGTEDDGGYVYINDNSEYVYIYIALQGYSWGGISGQEGYVFLQLFTFDEEGNAIPRYYYLSWPPEPVITNHDGEIFLIGSPNGWISPSESNYASLADWRLIETELGSRIYVGEFTLEAQPSFRFYTELNGWDGNSIGAQEADSFVEHDFDVTSVWNYDLYNGKGSFYFPYWEGGKVKITVNLNNFEMTIEAAESEQPEKVISAVDDLIAGGCNYIVEALVTSDYAVSKLQNAGYDVHTNARLDGVYINWYYWNGFVNYETDVTGLDNNNDYVKMRVTGEDGWSGAGFNISTDANVDLSYVNDNTHIRFAVRSDKPTPALGILLYDTYCITIGTEQYVDNQNNYPIVGSLEPGEWKIFDFTIGELKEITGSSYDGFDSTPWRGNIIAVFGGAEVGVDVSIDGVYMYTPYNPITPDPDITYYLIGAFNNWTLADEAGLFHKDETTGLYVATLEQLTSGFKINDGTWSSIDFGGDGYPISLDTEIELVQFGQNIYFDGFDAVNNAVVTFDPSNLTITISGEPVSLVKEYFLAGLNGEDFVEANKLLPTDVEGVYAIEYCEIQDNGYFKIATYGYSEEYGTIEYQPIYDTATIDVVLGPSTSDIYYAVRGVFNIVFDANNLTLTFTRTLRPENRQLTDDEWARLCALSQRLVAMGDSRPWDLSCGAAEAGWLDGVEIEDYHVSALNIENRDLSGAFPAAELLSFPALKTLNMSSNYLSGDLFEPIQKALMMQIMLHGDYASAIETLQLDMNSLSGNLGQFTLMSKYFPALRTLYVYNNHFSDVVPPLPESVEEFDAMAQDIDWTHVFDMNNIADDTLLHLDTDAIAAIDYNDPNINFEEVAALTGGIPTILFYDHSSRSYASEVAVEVLENGGDWGLTATVNSGNVAFYCMNNNNVFRGTENDTYLLYYPYSPYEVQYSHGYAQIRFSMGDANFIDGVTAADLQTSVLFLFGEYNKYPFNFTAADTYTDGRINVQDLVSTVNIMLADNTPATRLPRRAASLGDRTEVESEVNVSIVDGEIVVVSDTPVAVLDLKVSGSVDWSVANYGLTSSGSEHHLVAWSLTGAEIPAGRTVIGHCNGNVELLRATAADREARELGVGLGEADLSGIELIEGTAPADAVIYAPDGRQLPTLRHGVNIIVTDGVAKKVIVK